MSWLQSFLYLVQLREICPRKKTSRPYDVRDLLHRAGRTGQITNPILSDADLILSDALIGCLPISDDVINDEVVLGFLVLFSVSFLS
jgi:hypothetical protein